MKIRKKKLKKLDQTLEKIYHKVGIRNNLRDVQVHEIIDSMYYFIYKKMHESNLHLIEDPEDIKKIKTNFSIRFLGKLFSNEYLVKSLLKRKEKGRKLGNKEYGEKKFK